MVDAHLSQKAMKEELESIYSNQGWEHVEAPKRIKVMRLIRLNL